MLRHPCRPSSAKHQPGPKHLPSPVRGGSTNWPTDFLECQKRTQLRSERGRGRVPSQGQTSPVAFTAGPLIGVMRPYLACHQPGASDPSETFRSVPDVTVQYRRRAGMRSVGHDCARGSDRREFVRPADLKQRTLAMASVVSGRADQSQNARLPLGRLKVGYAAAMRDWCATRRV